ncbi:lipid IV(A) 3-deoxy-D-manno-octulosonic acid transferase [Shewanella intestini]|uniref:3-deoxy-D-manno-octulosonic acid transferase n=1 Tax=Shewanella intestini TaxID=2017544 RepID=A0ABS5I3M1_9GAMM|nr:MULTISPECIES: lipid IV(A) 3-deoxy-D-manno-octulosonic acid transferase [Shewanella]MBR9728626.1 3-deoxy-D-manno-octulosonic acid transferase [Shewanella intestini]MRG37318.1 3-deoxy-D-manno-octulosonic acid transferase [Shewanella sp. XMDDZSB0408]
MTRYIYSCLLYLLSPLVIMYLLLRSVKSPDYRKRWSERFGFNPLIKTDVLFHCVSMGETLAAVNLIKQLMAQNPDKTFTITTTSPTGSEQVVNAFGDQVQHCYLPLDFSFAVKRFLRQVKPQLCVIMETELWPNLVHFAHNQQIKIILANARLSQKSADKYQAKPKLSLPMLRCLDQILVQTQIEAERFMALGVSAANIKVTGSVKFDITIDPVQQQRAVALRSQWQKELAPVWVAGSVHPGEFDIMLNAHQQVLAVYPDALLIMAPRHPEQFDAAAQAINKQGFHLVRRSETQQVTEQTQVILGDTMGELLMLYGTADQAFIGGTLIENGGHNPLEPAAMGLGVYMGPHHWDFTEITQLLQQAGALNVVHNSDELAQQLLANFTEQPLLAAKRRASLEVVSQNRGALTAHVVALQQWLETTKMH